MPKSKHRKNAPARQHHAMPKAVRARADAMTHHDSLSGDHNPKMTHHDSPPGDENPPMTQNDSLCHASNPEMTQNDSLCKASMTQMSQNDSHFEVSSFEMTQNDSFSGLKCPTEHPLSPADEPGDDPENAPAGPAVSSEMTHPSRADVGPGVIHPGPVGAGPPPNRHLYVANVAQAEIQCHQTAGRKHDSATRFGTLQEAQPGQSRFDDTRLLPSLMTNL